MKKLQLILIAICFISFNSYSQLSDKEPGPGETIGKMELGVIAPELMIMTKKTGDIYTFYYKNIEEEQVEEFNSFSLNEEAFYQLYEVIVEHWENPPEEEIKIDLDKGYLLLKFTRVFGDSLLAFVHAPVENAEVLGSSVYFTRVNMEILFGKL